MIKYVKELKADELLTDKQFSDIKLLYSSLSHFIEDKKADEVNKIHLLKFNNQKIIFAQEIIYQDFMTNNFLGLTERMEEFEQLLAYTNDSTED